MIKYTKTNTLFLLIMVMVFFVFRGSAKRSVKNPKKILAIYLTKNIGDIIFTTPVIRAFKEENPTGEMYVIGSPKNEEMLKYNLDVAKYIVCPDSLFKLWRIIRELDVDYAFLFTTSSLELSLLYLANVPFIGVFSFQDAKAHTKSFRFLRRLCVQVPFYPGQNFALQNLRLLSPIGVKSEDTTKHLFFSPFAGEKMLDFYKNNNVNPDESLVVALAPGAGTKIKQWPADRFAKVADYIANKNNIPIFIVGGPGDRNEFEEMKKNVLKNTRLISCIGHSIDELKAFMSHVDIMIANDSAPIYIAESFDKATITIVGPTDENEHPPKGAYHRVVKWDGRGGPVLPSMGSVKYKKDKKLARDQIKKVTTEQVIATVDELIIVIRSKQSPRGKYE